MADDRRIDAVLRDVPLPAGLAERVAAAALLDDAAIDRLLTRVALPAGLAERMRSAVPAAGRQVVHTPTLAATPAPAAAGRRRSRWAVALPGSGIVAALVCLGALVFSGHEGPRWADPSAVRPVVVLAPAVESAEGPSTDDPIILIDMPPVSLPEPFEPSAEPLVAMDPRDLVPADETDVPEIAPFLAWPTVPDVRGATLNAADGRGATETGMRVVPVPRSASRRNVPRDPRYDVAFEMAHGESPFVSPETLATDRPPLTMATDSFDALCGRAGRRPPTKAKVVAGLRTEEILAALPAPAGDVAPGPRLTIHAVRSLRGRPETCLVEVGVAAGPLARPATAAIDSLLVLDHYSGSEPLLWPRICRALSAVANLMRAEDRLSVVVGGGGRPRLAGDRLDAAGIRRLAASLAMEPAAGTADFDATMRTALRERERLGGRPMIVLANAESVERARDEGRSAVAAWRDSLGTSAGLAGPAMATRFVIIDPAERAGQGPSGRVFGSTAADGLQIARELVERVFGVAGLTASQCRLEVSFDPKTVKTYRLVGHRQTAMESLASVSTASVDLHAGETVRVVYEVIPKAADGRAVTAKLLFRPPGGTADRSAGATLSLKAVESAPLPSPRGCELMLAVALGDMASNSPHAGPRNTVIQAVTDLAAAWRSRGDVTPVGALLLETYDRLGYTQIAKPATKTRPSGGERGRDHLTH